MNTTSIYVHLDQIVKSEKFEANKIGRIDFEKGAQTECENSKRLEDLDHRSGILN